MDRKIARAHSHASGHRLQRRREQFRKRPANLVGSRRFQHQSGNRYGAVGMIGDGFQSFELRGQMLTLEQHHPLRRIQAVRHPEPD